MGRVQSIREDVSPSLPSLEIKISRPIYGQDACAVTLNMSSLRQLNVEKSLILFISRWNRKKLAG